MRPGNILYVTKQFNNKNPLDDYVNGRERNNKTKKMVALVGESAILEVDGEARPHAEPG